MTFADPWLLLLLVLLPGLVALPLLRQTTAAVRFSSLHRFKRIGPSRSLLVRRGILSLRYLSLALLVVAAARPQVGHKPRVIRTEGVDIILAVDTSGSMRALDLEWNGKRRTRLEVVKDVVSEFIRAREDDRLGLVVFGQEAFTQCPLTLDHGVLLQFIEQLEIGMAGDRTAIGSGIGVAANRLKKLSAKSKVIILLTDGRNNAGSLTPAKAAEIAKTLSIKVYTVAAGGTEPAPFLEETIFGKRYVYQDVDIDETGLREIATVTNGKYFRATDAASLRDVYREIDGLERTEVEMKAFMEYDEKLTWFALPALLLVIVETVLLHTRYRKIP
ncbi:MAG: VWA domain-containing protein [Candidatus Schekmanbacteria bacterium]|nr:VWA domain-containing protein [Candidatus Schekmanbacteria bacterium]